MRQYANWHSVEQGNNADRKAIRRSALAKKLENTRQKQWSCFRITWWVIHIWWHWKWT